MREFNTRVELDKLSEDTSFNGVDGQEYNKLMMVTDKIVTLLAKHEVSMEDSYIILHSLADAIYTSAVYGFTEED